MNIVVVFFKFYESSWTIDDWCISVDTLFRFHHDLTTGWYICGRAHVENLPLQSQLETVQGLTWMCSTGLAWDAPVAQGYSFSKSPFSALVRDPDSIYSFLSFCLGFLGCCLTFEETNRNVTTIRSVGSNPAAGWTVDHGVAGFQQDDTVLGGDHKDIFRGSDWTTIVETCGNELLSPWVAALGGLIGDGSATPTWRHYMFHPRPLLIKGPWNWAEGGQHVGCRDLSDAFDAWKFMDLNVSR